MNKYAKWFQWAMWAGVVVNLVLGLPAILFPNTLLRFFHQRPSTDIVWTAFAGQLLCLLSLMYTAAARDPYRYRSIAKYALFARGCGVFFFLILWPHRYPLFGLLDGFFLVVQWPLYYLAMRDAEEWYPGTATR